MDLEEYDVVADKNEVIEQPRFETTVNLKGIKAMMNLEASFNPKALKMFAEAKIGNELLLIPESSEIALSHGVV